MRVYVNESRLTCCVANCIWEELNITTVCDCKWAMKQNEGVCPFTSVIKDCTAKTRSLGMKCVSLLVILTFFYGKTLSTTDIAPACCYEKDLQFSREI